MRVVVTVDVFGAMGLGVAPIELQAEMSMPRRKITLLAKKKCDAWELLRSHDKRKEINSQSWVKAISKVCGTIQSKQNPLDSILCIL
jgi:hypothetical protein